MLAYAYYIYVGIRTKHKCSENKNKGKMCTWKLNMYSTSICVYTHRCARLFVYFFFLILSNVIVILFLFSAEKILFLHNSLFAIHIMENIPIIHIYVYVCISVVVRNTIYYVFRTHLFSENAYRTENRCFFSNRYFISLQCA